LKNEQNCELCGRPSGTRQMCPVCEDGINRHAEWEMEQGEE